MLRISGFATVLILASLLGTGCSGNRNRVANPVGVNWGAPAPTSQTPGTPQATIPAAGALLAILKQAIVNAIRADGVQYISK